MNDSEQLTPPADDVREALAEVRYCPEHGDLLPVGDGTDNRSLRCCEAHSPEQVCAMVRSRGTVTDSEKNAAWAIFWSDPETEYDDLRAAFDAGYEAAREVHP